MRNLNTYTKLGLASADEVFGHFLQTVAPAIRTADFFVDWGKARSGLAANITPLALLNQLLGSANIRADFADLLVRHPDVIPVIPLLIATRVNGSGLEIMDGMEPVTMRFVAEPPSADTVAQLTDFADSAGLLQFLAQSTVTNLADYYFGVEVGLDSNGRKNRGGTLMESLVLSHLVDELGIPADDVLAQATASRIEDAFGFRIPLTEAGHRFDFAVRTPSGVTVIETNYYSGGGSKLYAIAGQYMSLAAQLRDIDGLRFVWVTDGPGWMGTKRPLRDTFDQTDYIFNLQMLREGALREAMGLDG